MDKFILDTFQKTLNKRVKFLTEDRLLYIFREENPVITILEFADYLNLSLYNLKTSLKRIRKDGNKKNQLF